MNSLLCKQCVVRGCYRRGVLATGVICPDWHPIEQLKPVVESNAVVRMERELSKFRDDIVDRASKKIIKSMETVGSPAKSKNPRDYACDSCDRFEGWNHKYPCVSMGKNDLRNWRMDSLNWIYNQGYVGVKPDIEHGCPYWKEKKDKVLKNCYSCLNTTIDLCVVNTADQGVLDEVTEWRVANAADVDGYAVPRYIPKTADGCPGWKERK